MLPVKLFETTEERGKREAESYLKLKGLLVKPESKWSNYKKVSDNFLFLKHFFQTRRGVGRAEHRALISEVTQATPDNYLPKV